MPFRILEWRRLLLFLLPLSLQGELGGYRPGSCCFCSLVTPASSAHISWVNMTTPNFEVSVDILCYSETRRKKRNVSDLCHDSPYLLNYATLWRGLFIIMASAVSMNFHSQTVQTLLEECCPMGLHKSPWTELLCPWDFTVQHLQGLLGLWNAFSDNGYDESNS